MGFGGRVPKDPGVIGPNYRYEAAIFWRPLHSCFQWYCEYLGVERGRGVVVQYRIHSFERWPIAVHFWWTR